MGGIEEKNGSMSFFSRLTSLSRPQKKIETLSLAPPLISYLQASTASGTTQERRERHRQPPSRKESLLLQLLPSAAGPPGRPAAERRSSQRRSPPPRAASSPQVRPRVAEVRELLPPRGPPPPLRAQLPRRERTRQAFWRRARAPLGRGTPGGSWRGPARRRRFLRRRGRPADCDVFFCRCVRWGFGRKRRKRRK